MPEANARMVLQDSLLSRLSEALAAQMGLHFPKERWRDLERGIAAAARDFHLPDAEACARWLLSAAPARDQIEVLASHLTVGETYFFREPRSFEILEQQILPELIRSRRDGERRLRIWSAGCATGEEPYSIAMLLDRLIPDPGEWNVTLLATDINPRFLGKAAEGAYGAWSFRGTPDWIRERYFKTRRDGRFELDPRIRKRVTFSYLNLAEDAYPSLAGNTNAMDVILCRNVLMYFAAERAAKVADGLHRCLLDGGWLIVGPAETSHTLFSRFATVNFPGVVLYRKTAHAGPRPVFGQRVLPRQEPSPQAGVASPEPLVQNLPIPREPPRETIRAEEPGLDGRARSCANEGRLAEAAKWCEQAIAADKLNPARHYLLANIRREQGQNDAAAQSLQHALYLDPDFVLAHFALGNLRLSQGRRREAERHFENAQALLRSRPQDEILPEAEGLTAGRLGEIIASVRSILPRANKEQPA